MNLDMIIEYTCSTLTMHNLFITEYNIMEDEEPAGEHHFSFFFNDFSLGIILIMCFKKKR